MKANRLTLLVSILAIILSVIAISTSLPRTEYKSKNFHGFCKEQKISYNKMLLGLRNDSYREIKKAFILGLNVPKVTAYAE